MDLTIAETHTAKRKLNICEKLENGTLCVLRSVTRDVTTNFTTCVEITKYAGKYYPVHGTIHMSYIVVSEGY